MYEEKEELVYVFYDYLSSLLTCLHSRAYGKLLIIVIKMESNSQD